MADSLNPKRYVKTSVFCSVLHVSASIFFIFMGCQRCVNDVSSKRQTQYSRFSHYRRRSSVDSGGGVVEIGIAVTKKNIKQKGSKAGTTLLASVDHDSDKNTAKPVQQSIAKSSLTKR